MATPTSTWSNIFPPKATWSVEQIPDLTGRVMIVTGGYTGIGKETVLQLLKHNAKVYIAGRSKSKADAAIADLRESTGKDPQFITLDLADLQSVKAAAAEYQSKETRLDVLFNSGGVMFAPRDQLTKDGYDLEFGTNFLGHFYFTKLLLPTLLATAKISSDGKARVINTSSVGHTTCKGLDLELATDTPARKKASMMTLYGQSKFGNVVFANELARRYSSEGIISVSLHPGTLKTELARHMNPISRAIATQTAYPVPMGALTQLYAGTTPDVESISGPGHYFVPWARLGGASEQTNDQNEWTKAWEWCEEQVKDV